MVKYYASKSINLEKREIENSDFVKSIAAECMVLLENNKVLPFEIKTVALFGSGARMTVKGGTGSGDVNSRSVVNIEQGFINSGIDIVTESWLFRQEEMINKVQDDYFDFIKAEAERINAPETVVAFANPYKDVAPVIVAEEDCVCADAAVYVISRNSGEGCDRYNDKGDYQPYDEEIANLKMICNHYDKVVLVLNIGGVMELTEIKNIEGIGAVLLMTQLGNIGGDAVVEALIGKKVPSGKTTDTWAKSYFDYPSSAEFSHNGSVHDEDYSDDIYVGYKYFDSFDVDPLYPFGYGLSYTEFEIINTNVSLNKASVEITAEVKNIGNKYSGKEVLQVYVSQPQTEIDKPIKQLVAFSKSKELKPGESQTISVSYNLSDMASYSEKTAEWVLEAGEYILRVGNSSANTKVAAVLTLDETKAVIKCKNNFSKDKEIRFIKPERDLLTKRAFYGTEDATRLTIDSSAISCNEVKYQDKREEYSTNKTEVLVIDDVISGKCSVEELVSQLSVEELAEYCVGTLRADSNSIVGNASATVPGAAGDTSSICYKTRNIKGMIMADGPAGLRLQPHFKTDLNGNLLPGGDVFGGVATPFDSKYDEKNSVDYYQYCTAIPIGWGLGQSWNEEMVEKLGRIIGGEMKQFGVDLWLAPAINIHRNPLCGRNFEYYSEDPLVSGRIAKAITKGFSQKKEKV